jgi:glycosyltransferase involved in cell wall biosynthesis
MRVLHVLPSLDQRYGGPLRVALELSAGMGAHGIESEVLGFGSLNAPDNPVPSNQIHALPVTLRRYCYSRQLRPWLDCNLRRFDGVVMHGSWLYPNFAIAHACWKASKPYACVPHGMLDRWSVHRQQFWKKWKKLAYWNFRESRIVDHARCIFFTTQREKYEFAFTTSRHQIVLSPFGVNLAPACDTARSRETPSPRTALFLGRIHPKKNLEFLISAWGASRLSRDWRLIIAGPGDQRYISQLSRQAGQLDSCIQFETFAAAGRKSALLQNADWFLLPSQQENFGVAVLEAMSYGCPVAVSNQVYLADELGDAAEVLPLNPNSWIRFFRYRMPDERARQHRVRAGRSILAERFHPHRISAAWASAFRTVFS